MSNFSNMKSNFLREKRTLMPRIFIQVVVIHSIFCDFFMEGTVAWIIAVTNFKLFLFPVNGINIYTADYL